MSKKVFKEVLYKISRSSFIMNVISLSYLQYITIFVPILILPVIIRTIGYDKYGQLMIASAAASYVAYFIDYGFNLLGTREVARNKSDATAINQIHSSIIASKLIISFAIFTVIYIVGISNIVSIELLFLYAIAACSKAFVPTWIFRGIERVNDLVIYTTISQVIYILFILIGLREAGDYKTIPLAMIISNFVLLFLSWYWLRKKEVNLVYISAGDIKRTLKQGWPFFISNISTAGYTSSTVIILGLFAAPATIGAYAAAEKLINAASGIFAPLLQATYPIFSRISSGDRKFFQEKAGLLIRISWFMGLTLALILFYLSDEIIIILFSQQSPITADSVRILALIPLISLLGNLYGVNTLLTHNREKTYVKILLTSGISHIGLSLILINFYDWRGAAISVLLTQFMISYRMSQEAKKVLK